MKTKPVVYACSVCQQTLQQGAKLRYVRANMVCERPRCAVIVRDGWELHYEPTEHNWWTVSGLSCHAEID